MNQRISYARVSADDQRLGLQRDELVRVGCSVIYEEAASGKSATYAELEHCRKALRCRDMRAVMAYRARSYISTWPSLLKGYEDTGCLQ